MPLERNKMSSKDALPTVPGWMQTYTGKMFFLENPRPGDVCIDDIAHALSNVCRFAGHSRKFYSVAEHCIHVSRVVPESDALCGLLHDATEAYLCDIPKPLKILDVFKEYRKIEARLESIILEKFKVPSGYFSLTKEVKIADTRMLRTEKDELHIQEPSSWGLEEIEPYDKKLVKIMCLEPSEAERAFLARFEELKTK